MRISMRNMMIRCLAVGFGILMAASDVTAQETNNQTPSKAELQKLYTDYLSAEGYKPEVDGDGDVQFKREGKTYFIAVSDRDPEYFRVVLPYIWPIESEKERVQVLVAADESNAKSKVSKVFTVKDYVWVSIEVFLPRPEDFKGVFERSMSALDNGRANFTKKMRE